MRYDPMLATALSIDADDIGGRTAQWRQLVDLLIQANDDVSDPLRVAAIRRIASLRTSVPIEQRRRAASQLAGRAGSGDVAMIFATDEPAVAAPFLARVQLDDDAWRMLIRQVPPPSRALLRNRRDLPEAARRALASYGASDFALPGAEAGAVDPGTQIRDLVARIEAFRLGATAAAAAPSAATNFAFETNVDGLVDWVSGAPREALIGVDVAVTADADGPGVDGQAAGAFSRRAPFRDARLAVAGSGPAGGKWLISATPVFNPRDGRFAGYHGTARRPRADEVAGPALFAGTALPTDSLRQLIHELRTPLNAILGFADMIDQQLLGPAAFAYRARARAIVEDGRRLLAMVDDLDETAQMRAGAAGAVDEQLDARRLLLDVERVLQPAAATRGVRIRVTADAAIEMVDVRASLIERMMMRLIGAAVGNAAPDEVIAVDLSSVIGGHVRFGVSRPTTLAGVGEATLLDPSYDVQTPFPDAPLLGLGFTLHLVRGLVRGLGGRLAITEDAFIVTLPGSSAHADLPAGTP